MKRSALFISAVLISSLAVSACGGGDGAPASPDQISDAAGAAESVPGAIADDTAAGAAAVISQDAEAMERVEIGGMSSRPLSWADSVESLARFHEYVVVARVTSVGVGYPLAETLVEHLVPKEPLPADHPKASITPDPEGKIGPVGSRFQLEVLRVIGGSDVARGETLAVTMWGGVIDGVRYEDAGDPLLEVGTTYLFFLNRPAVATFTSLPFARFEISEDGRLQRVTDHYDIFGAITELRELPLEDAITKIDEAIVVVGLRDAPSR